MKRGRFDFEMNDDVDQPLLDELRQSLGAFGFQWLCACAVYPGLRFPLTVHLGRRLAEAVDRPAPDEEEHMALCRLPWFRRGWMPEALRLALLQSLLPEHRRTVREAIEELFYNAIYQKLDDSQAGPALDFDRPSSDWRARFEAFGKTRSPTSPEQDAIFVRYMMGGAPTEADLRLDRRLRQLFGVKLSGWLDQKTLAAAALALIAVSLAWLGSERIVKPMVSESEIIEALTPAMVVIPDGTFMMGALQKDDEFSENLPSPHEVTVPSFAIGKHEVTVGEFAAFVAATDHQSGGCYTFSGGGFDFVAEANWETPGFEQTPNDPVVCVSWEDAQAYIEWLNGLVSDQNLVYRLPSEAEWEFAARAGSETRYFWGDDQSGCRFANGSDETAVKEQSSWSGMPCDDGFYTTAPVGTFEPNRFGLYDMTGNVWEWVEDSWHGSYEDAPTDGTAWIEGINSYRVIRGGSWYGNPELLRSAIRGWLPPHNRNGYLGFRLARTLTP